MTTIFTCNDSFEAMMTCVYQAWDSRLGHRNIRLMLEPVEQQELFCDYIHVEGDPEKTEKVVRSIRRKISDEAYSQIFKAAMAFEPDRLDTIYRFLLLGFTYGRKVTDMLFEPAVIRILELSRKVGNEAHYFREFTRFVSVNLRPVISAVPSSWESASFGQSVSYGESPALRTSAQDGSPRQGLSEKVYVAHIEPKCNILTITARHFEDRMPSEHWIILDDNRLLAAVHPKDQPFYLTTLSPFHLEHLLELEKERDVYTDLWQEFFDTIGIQARANSKCQRTMLPLWYRKHMTEFL